MNATIRRFGFHALAAAFSWGATLPAARAAVSGQQLLGVDQTAGSLADGGISSNLPNLSGGPRSAQAADDFKVTTAGATEYWRIQTISVLGQNVSAPTVDQVLIRVYTDNGGLPGSLLVEQTSTSISGAPNFIIGTSVILPGTPAGRTYWLSVQANVTTSSFASWNWQASSNGDAGTHESAWIDTTNTSLSPPLNGFVCAAQWGRRKSDCNIPQGTTQPHLAFRLDGDIVTLTTTVFLPLVARQ